MKNNVNVLSKSTIATVVLSTIIMSAIAILLTANASFAKELGDEFGGPGIGMKDSSWDGSITNRIYGYGNLNGIVGDEVISGYAYNSNGPTVYVEYDEKNPINHYLIDMGPTSANNDAYSLHFINDGGPGMTAFSNELGSTQIYGGGPGLMVSGLSNTENVYVDNGPTVADSKVNPSDYVKLLNMKPGDFVFEGSSKEAKLSK